MMERHELLERYEALGNERDFRAAKQLYDEALAQGSDARLLNDYGYLLYCHGRNEIRRAVEQYERAIELDLGYDKPHVQLIAARAALEETELSVGVYERRLEASPREVREHRFLANAYLRAHAYGRALEVIRAGLRLAPDDAALITLRGEAHAGLGDPEGALADWQLALEREPDDIGALYSSAFLLEREGRMEEAVEAWRSIIEWHEVRGSHLQAVWPRQELERLRAAPAEPHAERSS